MVQLLKLKLENASLDKIAELALKAIGPNASAKKNIDVKDISGNSGAKTYVCSLHEVPTVSYTHLTLPTTSRV